MRLDENQLIFENNIREYMIDAGDDMYWDDDEIWFEFSSIYNIYLSITSKNEALLNIKHDNGFIRWYCGKVLRDINRD
jgi:hypothetical protein